MARKLTRAEFEKLFGVSVDDYLRTQNTSAQPEQTSSFYDAMQNDPNLSAGVKSAVIASQDTSDEWKSPTEGSGLVSLMPEAAERFQQNIGAGIMAIPAAVPALSGLARTGIPAATEYLMSDDPDASFTNMMAQRIFTPEAMAELDEDVKRAVRTFIEENPNADEAAADAFGKQYINSDEFYNKVTSLMPADFKAARVMQDFANDASGLNLRSDQMSAGDEVSQAVGGALVGLPSSAVKALGKRMSQVVGTRIMNNLGTRVALRGLEALTPMTLPLTPGNIALNAGVGAALTEGVRYLQGEETLFDYDAMFDKFERDPALPAAAILGLGALNPRALSRGIARQVEQQTDTALRKLTETEALGRPLGQQDPNAMQPTQGASVGLGDDISQVQHAAQQFGASVDQLDEVEMAAVSGSYNSRKEIENRVYNYGELDPGYTTVPLAEIDRDIASLGDPAIIEDFNTGLHAISRRQDEQLQLRSYQQNIEKELGRLSSSKLSGNTAEYNAARTRLAELQGEYQQILADTPASRSSMSQWSRPDVARAADEFLANPQYRQIYDKVVRYSNDLLNYAHRNGYISKQELTEMRSNRPLYYVLHERSAPSVQGLRRRATLFGQRIKDSIKGSYPDDTAPDVLSRTGRDLSVRDAGKVELPADVVSSLRRMTSDVVQQVQVNEARKGIIDVLRNLPDAEGKLLRPHVFRSGNSQTTAISREQYNKMVSDRIIDPSKYVMVNDGGKIQLWEFADQGIANLMKFQPNVTVPVMNAMRRVYQSGLTGLNPAFAAVQMFREPSIAALTKPTDRTLGWLNTFTHRLLQGTSLEGGVLEKAVDAFDYTRYPAAMAQVPVQLWQRSAREIARRVAEDLANDRGVFGMIARMSGGKDVIQNIANQITTTMEKTSYGLMTGRMSTSFGHMNALDTVYDDFAKVSSNSRGILRTSIDAYKAVLESMQMSTRVAFWSENLGNLSRKYGGVDKIPEREMDRLVLDTRNLGGDMSRRSKSRFVQGAASITPYGNTIIQGTRHFLAAAIPNTARRASNDILGTNFLTGRGNNFWPVAVGGVFVPVLVRMSVMSEWPEAEKWWYQDTPSWQRYTVMPIPTPEAIRTRVTTGKWPAGDPSKHWYKVPMPPEIVMLAAPFEAGMRATPMFSKTNVPLPGFAESMKQAVSDFASVPTPPVMGVASAYMGQRGDIMDMIQGQGPSDLRGTPLGGAQSDHVSPDNTMTKAAYEMIGAVGGTVAKNLADALNVGELAAKDGDTISEVLGKSLRTFVDSSRRGLPEVGVPFLYKANERKYAYTADAEYVNKTQQGLKPIFDQLTRERDTAGRAEFVESRGGKLGNTIKDPALKQIAEIVYDTINKKGDFKTAADAYALMNAQLHGLQRQHMSVEKYNTARDGIIRKQQIVRGTQARILRELEQQIGGAVGKGFEQRYGKPFSYDTLVRLIDKDTVR